MAGCNREVKENDAVILVEAGIHIKEYFSFSADLNHYLSIAWAVELTEKDALPGTQT